MTMPHIASPDVHVDHRRRRLRMYFHGLERFAVQRTRVALSTEGTDFEAREPLLGPSYFRVFEHGDRTYALAMPGRLLRSRDGLGDFEEGPTLFDRRQRHTAVLVRGDVLHVFYTRAGDAPERILHSTVDLSPPWHEWRASVATEILRPERDWEGASAPVEASLRGYVAGRVNQLRDPAVFEEDGRVFLLYAVAGESGIGLAELHFDDG